MTCRMNDELAAFVLHALEPAEEDGVEQHLVECDECLEEVGALALTASLLSCVRPEDAELLDAPAPLAPRSGRPAPAGARTRWRGRALLAAAAAVLVGSVAVPAGHLLDPTRQPPQAVDLHGVGRATGTRAEVTLAARDGGTDLHLTLAGAPAHGWCSLVARSADGRREIAATWPTDGHGRLEVSGTTTIPADRLRELSVVTDAGRQLVRIPVPPSSP
jgi:hypothetical protein